MASPDPQPTRGAKATSGKSSRMETLYVIRKRLIILQMNAASAAATRAAVFAVAVYAATRVPVGPSYRVVWHGHRHGWQGTRVILQRERK